MYRGEVWLINHNPTVGVEIQKTRPAVIISSDAIGALPLRVVVPLTDWKSHYQAAAWLVKIRPNQQNGLIKDSAADTFQIRSISTARFIRKLGDLDPGEIDQVAQAVGLVVEYPPIK